MYNYKQLPNIKAFQRYILGYYPNIRQLGIDQERLAGSRDNYKSMVIPRLTIPHYGIDSAVMLLDQWPGSTGIALADALDAFARLEYDSVFKTMNPKTRRPVAAWGRQHATCDPDHHSIVTFELWGEENKKLGLMYQSRTSDIIGSLASDYLTAVVIQKLLAAVFWREPGTLMFQGTIHYHEAQEPLLQALEPSDLEVDWLRFTKWDEYELPRWNTVLDNYHGRAVNIDKAVDRFKLLQLLAKAAAGELRKGVLL